MMLHEGDLQRSSTISNTLDLLNRKDEEIERLQKLALARHLHIEHLNADIRELKETRYSQVKAEAYKYLAEKLKAKKKRAFSEENGFIWCVAVEDIDAVLKELSSGDNTKELRPIPIRSDITLGGDIDI